MTLANLNMFQEKSYSKTGICIELKHLLSIFVIIFGISLSIHSNAEKKQNVEIESAFILVDKGNHKLAASKLEGLLRSKLSKIEELEIHHALGVIYGKLHNRPQAVRHYVRAITQSYPLADSAAFRLAELYVEMNNNDKAIKWYTELVNKYPKSTYVTDARWALTKLHLDKRQYEEAKTNISGIVEDQNLTREVIYALARCEEGLKNYSKAFQIHQKLIATEHSDKVADNAVGKLKMLARDHKSLTLTLEDRFNIGLVNYHHGNWKTAISDLSPLTMNSDTKLKGRALYYTGLSYQGRKWYNTAIKKFNSVIALGKKSDFLTRANYQKAYTYILKGSLTTAVKSLENFVKSYPLSKLVDKALYNIAQIHEKQGKFELALNAYSRLIDVDPGSEYADWAGWRIGWRRFDEKCYEESFKAFKGLKENFPGNRYAMGAHFWMAKIRERQNKPQLAKEIYKEVAKSRYWYYSARAKALLGMTSSELEPKVLPDAELPTEEPCPQNIKSLMRLRLYEDGIYQLTRYIDQTPNAARECFYNLITCYEKLSMYDKAREVADTALLHTAFENQAGSDSAKLRRLLYPIHYETLVKKYAKLHEVDTALIFAMILEESRYRRDAISWAGAIGLMQIMPATGKELARQLRIRRFRTSMLKDPEINIRMGTKYIGYLNSIFDKNAMLVTGAYNGGPGRMKRWIEEKKIKDIDEFVEKITIRETRLHIKKVINSYDHYVDIYGQPEVPAVNSALDTPKEQENTPILGQLNQ